jgi:hypothetical protein
MSDSRAFTRHLNPDPAYGKSAGIEDGYVHQSSPCWVLTFVRWAFRDTLRISNSVGPFQNQPDRLKAVVSPLVVRSDCIDLTVSGDKGSHMPQMEAILVETNVDYLTEVAPGDFVFVNILNWESDAENVAQRASAASAPINGIGDGFKGVFKVQRVSKIIAVNPESGIKTVVIKITGYAFTELSNMIYFNQAVASSGVNGALAFNPRIAQIWQSILTSGNPQSLDEIILKLTSAFIGNDWGSSIVDSDVNGTNTIKTPAQSVTSNVLQSPNTSFFMPTAVGALLGDGQVTSAAGIYTFVFGIQAFSSAANQSLYKGMNPANMSQYTGGLDAWLSPKCAGSAILKPEYWNQVKTWDVLSQYTNSPLNEFFACFRVHPRSNRVVPTVVFRQIPFTTEDFNTSNDEVVIHNNGTIPVTKFLSLPRWKLNPSMVVSQDLGRDEAARINFVQVFGKTAYNDTGTDYAAETARINYVQDINDIQRSGLRPAVISSMFDILSSTNTFIYSSPTWAKIIGDALIGGHLKFNGTIVCVGLPEPVAVGDNLEYDNVVYHIESMTHKASIADGKKTFRTILSVSQGVSVHSSAQYGTLYPGMNYGNSYKEREVDYTNNQILPGVSESQDIPGRPSLDQPAPLTTPNGSFPQPKEIRGFLDAQANKPTKAK